MIQGKQLRQIKDRTGAALTDGYLISLVAKKSPWLQQVYNLASGYIHLSDKHFWQYYSRSPVLNDGQRHFSVGAQEQYVDASSKEQLLDAFVHLTEAVPELVNAWTDLRVNFGTNSELLQTFERAA
jgi:hypothetical protein